MRLFAALVPQQETLDDIEVLIAPLRKDSRLRWSPRELWHVTTAFFGDVDDDQFRSLADGLERAASRSHVGLLTLTNATEFNGKTLVLEVAGDTEGLGELARRCANSGRTAGISMEHRRYRPHLTVGRTNRSRDLSSLVLQLIGSRTCEWDPVELVLMDSMAGARPHYVPLASWPLAAGLST